MLTLSQIQEVHKSHNYGKMFPDRDLWVPIYNDAEKKIPDWFSLGNAYHNGKSHVDMFGYPGWGNVESNQEYEHMKGIIFSKKETMKYITMPAYPFSIREVGLNKVVVLMRSTSGDHYLKIWDTRTEIKIEDCTVNDFIRTRSARGGDPDRDIDIDIEKNWLYCFGDECLNKLSLNTFEFIDSTDLNDSLSLLRLDKKKSKCFVITGINQMHIIDTKTMLVL